MNVAPARLANVSLALVVAIAVGIATPEAAWADNLDDELLVQAKKIVTYLKANGLHDVGVLRFRTQLPGHPPTFMSGPLNVNLADRFEAALILSIANSDDIRILHDAGAVIAAKGQNLSYLRAADREKMFALKYPVAWGAAQVQPDVFLSGLVEFTRDEQKKLAAQVTIIAMRPKMGKPAEVREFPLRLDAALVSDAGVSRRSPGALADFDDVDPQQNKGKPPQKQEVATPLVELVVLYGEQKNTPAPHPSKPRWELIPQPKKAGQGVSFYVRNPTKETLAIVLKLNGLNTLDRENLPTEECRKWVLEPGGESQIDGYHLDVGAKDFKVDPFKTLGDEEWESMATSIPAAGQIELAVFVRGPKPGPPKVEDPEKKPIKNKDGEMKVSLRGLSRSLSAEARVKLNLDELKALMGAKKPAAVPRGGLDGDAKLQFDRNLELQAFPNPIKVQHRFIEYWSPPGK